MGVEKAKLVLAMSSYFQGSHVLKSLPLSEDLRGHDLGGKHDLKRLRHNHINDFSQRGQMGYGGAMSTPPLAASGRTAGSLSLSIWESGGIGIMT